MAHEIECKIALTEQQVSPLENRIRHLLGSIESEPVVKKDTYFTQDGTHAEFRLRRSHKSLVVTRKFKQHRDDGVEVNREIEFSVLGSQDVAVEAFVRSLGFRELICKEKRGTLWRQGELTIELVHVHHLGWFLEMELLICDEAAKLPKGIDDAVVRLSKLRTDLGVGDMPLEPRYYIDILRERQS